MSGQRQKAGQESMKKKKIIVGLDDSFVPMGFRDKDGKLTGF